MNPPPSLKPKSVWVGIDPGFSGAIAVIDERGRFLLAEDMPVKGEGRQSEFDLDHLVTIIAWISRLPKPRVFLEYPTTRPDESAESSKRFGVGLGLLEGMFTYAGMPVTRVAPNKWKGRLGLMGKDKDELKARQQAVEMATTFIRGMPDGALLGPRGGLKDGRAEALLIAWEALTCTMEGLRNQPVDVRLARVMFGGGRRRKKSAGDGF